MEKKMQELFSLMSKWKGLPKYQMERRADIFFALYLPTIWEAKGLGAITHDNIIPEFPIKNEENNRSCNIDYVVFCDEKVYYVELKTDANSFKSKQLDRMKDNRKINEALKGVEELASDKYGRGEYKQGKYNKLTEIIKEIKQKYTYDDETDAQICYIGSRALENKTRALSIDHFITFSYISSILENKEGDDLATAFSGVLEDWDNEAIK